MGRPHAAVYRSARAGAVTGRLAVTGDEAMLALREMLAWKQQELARQAAPAPSPVSTVEGYLGLWDLRRELSTALAAEHDPAARLPIQAMIAETDSAIAAAKADPALAAQIRAWWLSRYK